MIPLLEPRPCPAHGRLNLASAARVGFLPRIARHAAGLRRPDQGRTADLTGIAVWRGKGPGQTGRLTTRTANAGSSCVHPADASRMGSGADPSLQRAGATVLLRA